MRELREARHALLFIRSSALTLIVLKSILLDRMPPKSKDSRKSVSFHAAATARKDMSGLARDEGDKKVASLDEPSLVEAISAAAMPSDGASPIIPSQGPG
jgi:hypothetical protein